MKELNETDLLKKFKSAEMIEIQEVATWRKVLALIVAVFADLASVFFTLAPSIAIPVNFILVGVLSLLLGFRIIYIPSAFVETVPLLSAMPFWTATCIYSLWKTKKQKRPLVK